jgi:hypothetical protein
MPPRTDSSPSSRNDKPETSGQQERSRSGSGKDRPSLGDKPSKNTVAANEKKFGGKAAEQQPNKGSTGYTDKQLKATPKENTRSAWQTERGKHTKAAEQADRKGVQAAKQEHKAATGKDMKPPPGRSARSDQVASNTPGKKVEQHHHSGVSESRKAGLSPKVAGEKGRTTALASSKSDKVYGVVDGKKYTHHNTVSKMDKAEQARTAKAMGRKGESPQLPKGDAGRKGMVDSSGTSKWRTPETVNQAERAKQDWTRKEPVGPKVDKDGSVVPDKTKPAAGTKSEPTPTPKGDPPASGPGPKGDPAPAPAPGPGPKGDAPVPKGDPPAPKAPKGEPHAPGGGGGLAGKLGGLAGAAGEALGIVQDVKTIVAHDYPEKLPEGTKVELSRPGDVIPWMREPTGYSVEKTNGEVIYRDRDGNQVSKAEAMRASSAPAKDQANWA